MLVTSTLLVGKTGLEQAKKLLVSYKQGEMREMTPQLWKAKKIVDSTLHPGTTIAYDLDVWLVLTRMCP